jgi:methionyl aminopeptidase
MYIIKTSEEIALMKIAGRITAEALCVAEEAIRPGISTKEIDIKIRRYIEKCGATPGFLGYGGFPGSACISLNREVIHGIPSAKVILREGDIVKVDVGARYRGYNGDSARTFPVGKVSEEAERLISVTKESFYRAMPFAKTGYRIGDIGAAIEDYVISNGFSVVKDYTGHGIGRDLHEDPSIPNYRQILRGPRLYPGMTLAIEPMVNVGVDAVKTLSDKWTVVTADGKLSAHYENTILITEEDPLVLTDVNVG